jgi:hypothetical protein
VATVKITNNQSVNVKKMRLGGLRARKNQLASGEHCGLGPWARNAFLNEEVIVRGALQKNKNQA